MWGGVETLMVCICGVQDWLQGCGGWKDVTVCWLGRQGPQSRVDYMEMWWIKWTWRTDPAALLSPKGPRLVLWRPGTSAQLCHSLVVCPRQMVCISRLWLLPFKGGTIQLTRRVTESRRACADGGDAGASRGLRHTEVLPELEGAGQVAAVTLLSHLSPGAKTHSSGFSLTGQWSIFSS